MNTPPPAPPARPWSRVKPWARDLALALALFAVVHVWRTRAVPRGVAPDFALPGLRGETLTPRALRGHPAVVYFWATWCGVCRAERGTIESLAEDHDVLTVASESGDARAVQAYASEHGVRARTAIDADGAVARRYGVAAFPTILVLTPDGRVAFAEVGYTSRLGLLARLWLARLW